MKFHFKCLNKCISSIDALTVLHTEQVFLGYFQPFNERLYLELILCGIFFSNSYVAP